MKTNSNKSELKDFQKATVERVMDRFNNGQNRVLVADEVGLGKTLIARNVIKELYNNYKNNGIYKVAYICSNQNIANQNIEKLHIDEDKLNLEFDSYRLSMQSLNIYKQEKKIEQERKLQDDKILQLIPLTPETSFKLTFGRGLVKERALIYLAVSEIFKLNDNYKKYSNMLKDILKTKAVKDKNFECELDYLKNSIEKEYNLEEYINNIKTEFLTEFEKAEIVIKEETKNQRKVKEKLSKVLENLHSENENRTTEFDAKIIKEFRIIFSKIGLAKLKPDLVIMDEFQRFKDLLHPEENSPTQMLTDKFFNEDKNLKILLLSATPYKPYATREENSNKQNSKEDTYYTDFLELIEFLCKDKEKYKEFKRDWETHSYNLKTIDFNNFSIIKVAKDKAEKDLYDVMVRTERISNINKTDSETVKVKEEDIESYIQIANIVNELKKEGIEVILPDDFVKSCPYLLTYMSSYKLKEKIEEYYKNNKEKLQYQNMLWIDEKKIEKYEYDDLNPITKTNARIDKIRNIVFKNNIEKLLWLPPTKKYYEFEKPYNEKNIQDETKTLIFSSWEMVPKMVSTMLSYEAERKTTLNKTNYFKDKSNSRRLEFKINNRKEKDKQFETMSIFTLLYPSETLSAQFNKIELLNNHISNDDLLKSIEDGIDSKIQKLRDSGKIVDKTGVANEDLKWYYLLPLILDSKEYVNNWFEKNKNVQQNDDKNEENTTIKRYYEKLRSEYNEYLKNGKIELASRPKDLLNILAYSAIAAPANCAYRYLKDSSLATEVADCFRKMFGSAEAKEVLDTCYKDNNDYNTYWKNVLNYCFAGNLQAVLDEYFYMIEEIYCLNSNNKNKKIVEKLKEAMSIRTTSFKIDTYDNFKKRINNQEEEPKKMRTNFAVCFSKGETEELENRRENIRAAFNSPFRPYVLTTTSIGQEGLDFHLYCRRIVHWNLPSNPIDLEQREGRINRFKCLAIRRYIANSNDVKEFKDNIWTEMFENVSEKLSEEEKHGGMVPYWTVPNEDKLEIERIVPIYEFSRDINNYNKIQNILDRYKLALGQENQEEIIEKIYKKEIENSEENKKKIKDLFFDLSPYSKKPKSNI